MVLLRGRFDNARAVGPQRGGVNRSRRSWWKGMGCGLGHIAKAVRCSPQRHVARTSVDVGKEAGGQMESSRNN